MKIGLALLCAGTVAFMLRVLIALVTDIKNMFNMPVKVYIAKFNPKSKPPVRRGDPIIMELRQDIQKSATRRAAGVALVLTAAVLLGLPAHAQQTSRATNNTPDQPSTTHQELIKELDAMKKRIEQLEAQLGNKKSQENPASETQVPEKEVDSSPAIARTTTEAVSHPSAPTKPGKEEPFAFADWTWLNGNPRTKTPAFDSKFFTPEIRVDVAYHYDFNHPKDDTIAGSGEVFRSNEVGLTDLGIGGDFHYDNVRARVLSQIGLYSTATPRNDASYTRGQWDLANAYRYVSEAWGGYHWDAMHGVNVDAGIFLSYVGLFSFYQFDNWAYQPSYVSSNTPWFFTGLRVQMFPTKKLKIEPWLINGWQSYARFNGRLGLGGQILYRPNEWLSLLTNNYGAGEDALGIPNRTRYHTDNSIQLKYYDHPERFLDKMAFSVTGDAGCETGGGVNCTGNRKNAQGQIIAYKQSFLGYMVYNRWWFHRDRYGVTIGGGQINNPGRYLVLLPPINGATAASGTPYFTENPGDQFKAWDVSVTYDYMPSQYITFRWEFNHRHANVPYFSGPGGITPSGGNTGTAGSIIAGFQPDLRHTEDRGTMAILVKF
ncbi:MAG TPA: outer membrane beta-barrel protein [Terriglobales bacterium]|nr:outer membrane beta-barrel protein [Terriglobales bacterium]